MSEMDINSHENFDKQVMRGNRPKASNKGTVICVVAILLTVMMIFAFPRILTTVVYGVLGIYAYSLFVLLFAIGIAIRFRRRFKMRKKYFIYGSIMLFALFTSIHLAFTHEYLRDRIGFGEYLGHGFGTLTPGGVLFALPTFVIFTIAQLEGSFIILGCIFIICAGIVATEMVSSVGEEAVITKNEGRFVLEPGKPAVSDGEYEKINKRLQQKVEEKYQELVQKNSRKNLDHAKSELGLTKPPMQTSDDAIYDTPVPLEQLLPEDMPATQQINQWTNEAVEKFNEALNVPDFLPHQSQQQQVVNYAPLPPQQMYQQPYQSYVPQPPQQPPQQQYVYQQPVEELEPSIEDERLNRRLEMARARMGRSGNLDDRINARGEQTKMEIPAKQPKPYVPRKYIKPPIDLIKTESSNLSEFHEEAIEKQALLDEKLKEFGVNAKVTSYTVAPAVTRFEIQLSSGVRVSQVEQLSKDISYILGSSNVRLELIEGKNAIGIEVPNKRVGIVSIKDILASREFQHGKGALMVAIGKNISDDVVVADIHELPHLLIAGSTGSGKSVCLHSILTSLLYRAHPDEAKLLLVDMKRVELNMYNEIPHMLIPRTIKEAQQVINALKWMQAEMTRRYDLMEKHGVNKIGIFHSLPAYQSGALERMPYIIMVIDEAADLMARGKKEVEDSIKSLASLGRAAGVHIIMATQRPSVDVITGVIKANLPTRIAFRVGSRHDSSTIIDSPGAEKLVGRGDMLFLKDSFSSRVQCSYIEIEETRKVMNFIRENNKAEFDTEIEDIILNGPPVEGAGVGFGDADGSRGSGGRSGQDPMFAQVLRWLVRDDNHQRIASISGFQRQFGIGFARAGKIIDQLADAGYVSSGAGTKARQVLVTREEVDQLFGEG